MTIFVLWTLSLLCAGDACVTLADMPISDKVVEMKGEIGDHFLKRFPFVFRSGGHAWILDVVAVPKDKIEKEVLVKGRVVTVDGRVFLTNVFIDGVRLETQKEWHDSRRGTETNPFDP